MKCFILFVITCFFFISCTKDNGTKVQLITYRLEGLSDITLSSSNNNNSSFILTFNQQGNVSETVTLSFTGLPSGVTIDSTHVRSSKPDFSSYITFYNDGTAANGTYTATLHCAGTISKERTFSFNIIVDDKTISTDCTVALLGLWSNCTTNYGTGAWRNEITISTDTVLGQKRIIFTNGFYCGATFYGYLNCNNDSLGIPDQSLCGNDHIFGWGTCNKDSITITATDTLSSKGNYYYISMHR